MLGTGFGQGLVSSPKSAAVQPPSGNEVQDGLGNEYTLSTEERKDINVQRCNPLSGSRGWFQRACVPQVWVLLLPGMVQDDLHPTGHGGMGYFRKQLWYPYTPQEVLLKKVVWVKRKKHC